MESYFTIRNSCISIFFTIVPLLIFTTLVGATAQRKGKDSDFKRIEVLSKWIAYNVNPSVSNIRIVSANQDFTETYLEEVSLWNSFTLITGLDVKQEDFKITSLVLVLLDNINTETINFASTYNLAQWIRKYANRKWDHFLFIGTNDEIEKVWNHAILNKLKWKWGYSALSNVRRIFTSIQTLGNPLQPTTFSDITLLNRYFKPEMFAMGHNLRGRTFKYTGWNKCAPYIVVSAVHPNGDMEYDGSIFRIFNESFQNFNFTNDYQPFGGPTYAEYLENGTWTGIVGDLIYEEREFDVSLHLGLQIVWYDLLDVSNSVASLKLAFVTVEQKSGIPLDAFLRPFNFTVWICLILTCMLMTACMCIYVKCLELIKFSTKKTHWFFPMIAAFKIALEQNTKIIPGTKLLASIWLFIVIITGSAYRTHIISSLTFPAPAILPKTNDELMARTDYNIIINSVGVVEKALFQTSETPAIKALAKRAMYISSQFECVKSIILHPKTVCFAWSPMLLHYAADKAVVDIDVDPFVASSDGAGSSDIGVGFAKNSPYFAGFSYIINAMFESGFYNLWEKDVYAKQRKKGFAMYKNSTGSMMHDKLKSITNEIKGVSGMKPLKVAHLKVMFCIGIAGLILASFMFFVECGMQCNLVKDPGKVLYSIRDTCLKWIVFSLLKIFSTKNNLHHYCSGKKADKIIIVQNGNTEYPLRAPSNATANWKEDLGVLKDLESN